MDRLTLKNVTPRKKVSKTIFLSSLLLLFVLFKNSHCKLSSLTILFPYLDSSSADSLDSLGRRKKRNHLHDSRSRHYEDRDRSSRSNSPGRRRDVKGYKSVSRSSPKLGKGRRRRSRSRSRSWSLNYQQQQKRSRSRSQDRRSRSRSRDRRSDGRKYFDRDRGGKRYRYRAI